MRLFFERGNFREEVRVLVLNLRQRCKPLDWVEIISKDIVNLFSGHYQQIRQHMFVFVQYSIVFN